MDSFSSHLRPHRLCIICRGELIERRDLVLAILSTSQSYFGHTKPFYIPPLGPAARFVTLQAHKSGPISRLICRTPNCHVCSQSDIDFLLCHYTCLLVLQKHVYQLDSIDPVLEIVFRTGSFFNPWPLARTDYDMSDGPEMPLGRSPPPKDEDLPWVHMINQLNRLLPELQKMVQAYCAESEFWRVWKAMAWPKDIHTIKQETRSVGELGVWKRGLTFGPKSTEKFLLISVDGMGIKEVEYTDTRPTDRRKSANVWYTFLETTTVQHIQATLKDGRIRLSLKPPDLVLWDTPVIPDLRHCHLFGASARFNRLRVIQLENLVGLTFFVGGGLLYAIHSHYDPENSALETFLRIPDWRRKRLVWLFLPVAEGIEYLWLRTRKGANGQMAEPSLLFQNLQGKILTTGLYHEDSAAYTCRNLSSRPTKLVYDQPYPGEPILTFGAMPSAVARHDVFVPKYNLGDKMEIYTSDAPLQSVCKVQLYLESDETCRGILLHYHDGKQRVLGQSRGDLICQKFSNPVGLHFQNCRNYVRVFISLQRGDMDKAGTGNYDTIDFASEKVQHVLWLFNSEYDEIVRVENH
ncbi:hypothetical protein HYALB_00002215 [Hymenoscyphus albidus]|uniref:Uncharacterized protein n=1 Tax=Hymenoscyphus albidus TaxID=595503 RepID=A0A9N9Q3C6_9HELO|nr:hypothetical protein HYALB_00002215 [Hymenoscyphus albidus]